MAVGPGLVDGVGRILELEIGDSGLDMDGGREGVDLKDTVGFLLAYDLVLCI